MKRNRIIKTAIFLLIFALIFALFSCQTNDEETNLQNTSPANAAESANEPATGPEISDNLPEMDFNGYDFRVYMREGSRGFDFYAESENGDLINDAVYKRNKIVEGRFNINIVPVLYSDEWDSSSQQSILAGDDAYDLMSMHGRLTFSFAQKGLVLDWLTNMTYVNFDMPWWRDDITKGFAAFGKLYSTTGDISHLSLGAAMGLMFNKDLFKNLDIEYPYNDVIKGTWILDKFYSTVKGGSADLNGDGAITPDADRYGLASSEWVYSIAVFYHGGDRIVSLDDQGIPFLSVYNDRTVDIFGRFFDMLNYNGAACISGLDTPPYNNPESIDLFRENRALFVATSMISSIAYRDMEAEIGILPFPKYDETTLRYYTPSEAGTNLFIVPITAQNTERISIIVEALCAEGHKSVIPAFYEKSLKTKFSRDDESEMMLDYIKDGIIYDYGYYNDSLTAELASVGVNLARANNSNFTSFYERYEKKVQNNIEKLK